MSNFFQNLPDKSKLLKAIECAILGQQSCQLVINSTVGDLFELTIFLGLAINQKTCSDEVMLKSVKRLRADIIQFIKNAVPAYEAIDFDDIEALERAEKLTFTVINESNMADLFNELIRQMEEIQKKQNN